MSEDLSEEILELCVNVCEKKLSNNQEIAKGGFICEIYRHGQPILDWPRNWLLIKNPQQPAGISIKSF